MCLKCVLFRVTRSGTTYAIDPVCEQVTSDSSVLLEVTHGLVGFFLGNKIYTSEQLVYIDRFGRLIFNHYTTGEVPGSFAGRGALF